MEFVQIEKNMRQAINKIEEVGKSYAEAKAQSYQLQEMKKVVLAKLKNEREGSDVKREREALIAERYALHIQGTAEAIGIETRLRAELDRWKAQFEGCRSLLSMEKAKANL